MMKILLVVGLFVLTLAVAPIFAQDKYLKGKDLEKAKATYYDDSVDCEVMKLAEKISEFIDCSDWVLTYEGQYAIAGYKAEQDQALKDSNESSKK